MFDNYGLNDGGVSAYECECHSGMHIDTERAICEVVDDAGYQINSGKGRIIATSLYNKAFPFIRYDTEDLAIISEEKCPCGRGMPLLKEVIVRTTDFLVLNGVTIGSPVLTVLMGKFDIEQYQIIQETSNSIICRIVKGKTYSSKDEEYIINSFYSHVGQINVKFEYVDDIMLSETMSKHKFIINLTNPG